jgi:biotin carboxyl carrier protein
MENEIYAPVDGTILEIKVKQGDQLNAEDVLLVIGEEVVAAPVVQAAAPAAQSAVAPAPVAATSGGTDVRAPMPGLVLRMEVKVGDQVAENDLLMVMEAMKMENEIFAPEAGTIQSIAVKQGDQLMADDLLLVIG